MYDLLYWFGLVHVFAYSALGGTAVLFWSINRLIHRYGLLSELLRGYGALLKERKDAKVTIPG